MLSDRQVQAIVESLIADDSRTTQIERERTLALEYYQGAVTRDEGLPEGKSRVRSGDVLEGVELMKPGLMRIFMDAENIVEFRPRNAQDIDAAKQESDRVSHCYWQENDGFLNTLQFISDALLSKNGVFKAWWDDDGKPERETYERLTPFEFLELQNDTTARREIIEFNYNAERPELLDVVFETRQNGQVRIEVVPPEEFGVLNNTNTPNVQDARGAWHRTKKMRGDLIDAGYDRDTVMRIPSVGEDEAESLERQARYQRTDDYYEAETDRIAEEVWVTEFYGYIDRDEDDIPELLKVTSGGRVTHGTGILLDIEEVDHIPFASASPIVLTHQFYGLSLADLIMPVEDIKTTTMRAIVDNQNLGNHQRVAYNDRVNVNDLLTYRPGGTVYVEGDDHPGNSIFPIPSQSAPPQAFQLLEMADDMAKGRTGASQEASLLDSGSLANINVGTAMIARDQARAKAELIARTLAELGFAPLFRLVRELLMKHQDHAEVIELRGEFVELNPADWRERKAMKVCVGVGRATREKRVMAIGKVLERQAQLAQMGGMGTLVMPEQVHQALADEAELLGLEDGAIYYQDPRQLPPKPPQPDPQAEALQAQMMLAKEQNQVSMAKVQVEAKKVESAERLAMLKMQSEEQAQAARQQIEQLKVELAHIDAGASARDAAQKQAADMQKAQLQAELKVREMALKDSQEAAKRSQEQYRTEMQALTSMVGDLGAQVSDAQTMISEGVPSPATAEPGAGDAELSALIEELRGELEETRSALDAERAPKEVVRDADGFIVSLRSEYGERPVRYDENGDIVGIG